ncbi:MAG: hypothetical protein KAS32_05375 [Candidatus Peribacteraceae bacterium]|nr:hypothetical protein [Candidatus Peribacteraceae bacterium]
MTLQEILNKSSPGDRIFNYDSKHKIKIGDDGEMELWSPSYRKYATLTAKEMFEDDNWEFDHVPMMHHCRRCEVETKGHSEAFVAGDGSIWSDYRCGECDAVTRMKNPA